ncbi:MAG: HU family DNA-binding protein [Desulfomonile tiedjei]|nr:HU family DNA-binding protein [Desulfomonile tiedjei]
MTKDELVTKIAADSGISKKAAGLALNAVVGAIHDTLKRKEGSIRLAGLGTFKVVQRQGRNGINPQTKKKIKIPATKVPRFSASKALKEAVKKAK